MKKINYKLLGIFLLVVLIGFIFFPKYFISKSDQKCVINYHCDNLDCSELNKDFKLGEELVFYEPMCISNKCKCEWTGNLLHLE